jgi:hypothetical protein
MDIFKIILSIFFIYWLYKISKGSKENLKQTPTSTKRKKIILRLNEEKEILRNF